MPLTQEVIYWTYVIPTAFLSIIYILVLKSKDLKEIKTNFKRDEYFAETFGSDEYPKRIVTAIYICRFLVVFNAAFFTSGLIDFKGLWTIIGTIFICSYLTQQMKIARGFVGDDSNIINPTPTEVKE